MTRGLEVSRALVDLIARQPAFQSRQVTLAHPAQFAEQEYVFVQGVKASDVSRSLGKAYRRETLDVELGIVVEVNQDDAVDCLQRAYLMLSEVEAVLADKPTLDVDYVLFAIVSAYDQRSYVGDGKRIAEITVTVTVTANNDPEG